MYSSLYLALVQAFLLSSSSSSTEKKTRFSSFPAAMRMHDRPPIDMPSLFAGFSPEEEALLVGAGLGDEKTSPRLFRRSLAALSAPCPPPHVSVREAGVRKCRTAALAATCFFSSGHLGFSRDVARLIGRAGWNTRYETLWLDPGVGAGEPIPLDSDPRLLDRLQHKNLYKMADLHHSSSLEIVLEAFEEVCLSEAHIASIATDLLNAIEYLDRFCVVLCDLSMRIRLQEDGRKAQLALKRSWKDNTDAVRCTVVGTRYWTAPEVLLGEPESTASMIFGEEYALNCNLYFAHTFWKKLLGLL